MSFWSNIISGIIHSLFDHCVCHLKRSNLTLNSCAECHHSMNHHEHHSARRSYGWYQCLICECQKGRKFKDNLEFVEAVAKQKGLV